MTTSNIKEQAEQRRAICPEAYALTAKELVNIQRFNQIIWQFFDEHREFVGVSQETEFDSSTGEYTTPAAYYYIYNDESITLLHNTFKSKRFSLRNAVKVADRVIGAQWFSVSFVLMEVNPPSGFYMLSSSDKSKCKLSIATLDCYEDFISVWDKYKDNNAEALRQALRLEDEFLYLEPHTIQDLILIKDIASYAPQQSFTAPAGYIAFKATRESTALVSIGRAALDAATYDEINEAHNLTAAIGTEIRLKGKLINKKALVSVDKLERQLLDKACKSGFASPEIELSLDEFMERRRLTDRKEARKQFNKAANSYYELSYEAVTDAGRVRIRPLDAQAILSNSKAVFYFSKRFFDAHKQNQSIAYIPEGLLAMDGKQVNAYSIGVYVWDDIRRNLHNSNRRLKIRTLLEIIDLPEATGLAPSLQQRQIIEPFFKALSEASKPEFGDFSYRLVHSDGKPLSTHEQTEVHYSFNLFITCMIEIKLNHEPEYYTQLRQRKQANAEAKALREAAKVERDRATVEGAAKRKGRKPVKR